MIKVSNIKLASTEKKTIYFKVIHIGNIESLDGREDTDENKQRL